MASNELESMFTSTMNGIRDMIDVNTIIGNPIESPDGTVIIPVSKVSFGFGMGGWEQKAIADDQRIAGGSGGGVTVAPVGFLIVCNGNVKMLNIDSTTSFEKVMDSLPDVIKSLGSLFNKGND